MTFAVVKLWDGWALARGRSVVIRRIGSRAEAYRLAGKILRGTDSLVYRTVDGRMVAVDVTDLASGTEPEAET